MHIRDKESPGRAGASSRPLSFPKIISVRSDDAIRIRLVS
jgi:hypothetical protein